MKKAFRITAAGIVGVGVILSVVWFAFLTSGPSREVGSAVRKIHALSRPGSPAVSATLHIIKAEGVPETLLDRKAEIAFQSPGRLRFSTEIEGHEYRIGRNGDSVWLHVPHQNLAIEGRNDVPRFARDPASLESVELASLTIPLERWQIELLPALIEAEDAGEGMLVFRFKPWAAEKIGVPADAIFRLRPGEGVLPREIGFARADVDVRVALDNVMLGGQVAGGAENWGPPAAGSDSIERVALSHLDRFAGVALGALGREIPSLPPVSGERRIVATHGKGRLENFDGTRVLFLKGTPEEMGEQHGVLLKDDVHGLINSMVYGVGVGSSFEKGRWFFGEIEEAQSRLEPFIDPRYTREMDAMAAAAGVHPQEARLANFFPELFHCTGFALHGNATSGGRMFHGRVLDYLRGLGLEQTAVVMVVQPDQGNAWVNVGYAGFVGTVTAMNEKQVAIGEMGGRGEGNWDGKPMAQLMREVMERADTIDEAVAIMEKGPRTCEYYYVISDAKSMRAVGIKATPDLFETVWSGQSHPQLTDPVEDTVLMSAGDRYTELVKRVKNGWGEFDAESARGLMSRPVCMNSNIQSVLFAPDTLDFWVANADSENVASHTRFTRYNLRELLAADSDSPDLTAADPN